MTKKSMKERTVRYRLDPDAPEPRMSEAVRNMSEEELQRRIAEDPDAIDTSVPGFWDNAVAVIPDPKQQLTLRLDADVLQWFREGGKGYQTRINAVLRSYMNAQKNAAE